MEKKKKRLTKEINQQNCNVPYSYDPMLTNSYLLYETYTMQLSQVSFEISPSS